MIKRVLTTIAAVALTSVAGHSLALAQSYPAASPSGYTIPADPNYPPGGYPATGRSDRAMDAMPDFDSLDEEDAPPARGGRSISALPAPGISAPQGPVMSPDDPRYGRPASRMAVNPSDADLPPRSPLLPQAGAPVYSDRGVPQGPVMSPDDPRYGRPMAPPQVVYSNRGGDGAMRPPEAMGAPVTGALQGQGQGGQNLGANGSSVMVASLPPEDQPEAGGGEAALSPEMRRQEVNFVTKEPAGTIVVDTPNYHLYYVLGGNRAVRYGVRVGRDGFTWTGVQKITRKAEWPDWHPPTEMIERQPYLPRFMAGGPGNPLGARAMYLGATVYRIHGTNQPSTIGKSVSSGCIGMLNEDVSDLFDRAKVGTRVVVLPAKAPLTTASAQQAPGGVPAPLPGTQPTSVQPLPAAVNVR